MNITKFPERFNSDEAANILGVTASTLAVWRCTKRYPLPYVKIVRKVFYRSPDCIRQSPSAGQGGIREPDNNIINDPKNDVSVRPITPFHLTSKPDP